jgi:lipid A 3-O-deacylase
MLGIRETTTAPIDSGTKQRGYVTLLRRPALAAVAVAAALVGHAGRTGAQQLLATRIEEDNAQLAYWLPAPHRPDDEFTNGTRVSLSFSGARLWSLLLGPHAPRCGTNATDMGATAAASGRCLSTDFTLAQEMYTPADWHVHANPVPGQRPYAGQLSLTGTANAATPRENSALTLQLGVAGPPSLAGNVQAAWHRLIGYYPPLGWDHQIRTEPAFRLGATESRLLVGATIHGIPVFSLIPQASVSAGNILTGATAALEGRLGYGAGAPWSSGPDSHTPKFQIYALAAARADWVWTELVLDRASTDPAYTVSKIPWVGQYEFGGGVRLFFLEAEYRAVTRTQEYRGGPLVEPYAVMTVGVRRGW